MSGAPLPEPSPADQDNGPLEPAHEAAYYLGMGETFRILTRPGEPASPDVKKLRAAVRTMPNAGIWCRRGDEAARRIVTSNQRIRNLPQDPDQLWALLADVLQALDQLDQAPPAGRQQPTAQPPPRPPGGDPPHRPDRRLGPRAREVGPGRRLPLDRPPPRQLAMAPPDRRTHPEHPARLNTPTGLDRPARDGCARPPYTPFRVPI
ncbi:hypothetical protein [Streptomyces sp. NPDC000351]|uniref:hypothetical protein n=1 Tax=Streptomyces sp. NPDC000351 TaxID=3154250 RepID=UPI00331E75DA